MSLTREELDIAIVALDRAADEVYLINSPMLIALQRMFPGKTRFEFVRTIKAAEDILKEG